MGPKWSVPIGPMPSAVEGVLAPLAPTPPLPPMPPAPPASDASVLALDRHAAQIERHAARLERQAAQIERQMAMEIHRMERQLERDAAHLAQATHHPFVVQSGASDARIVLTTAPASVVHTIPTVPREIVLAMLWFWGLGALVVGLAWATAYTAAARAVRLGTPETDEDLLATWERVRLLSGVSRPVRLLRSPALDVPIAWGWGHAAVVLPASADTWDDDRMEAVLLHELAHILRGDAVSQLIAQIALVLHWANPLAWLAYRNVLLERERACDDVVIEHGARPSAYADHLVQVARDLRRRSAALAAVAPMARHSDLEDRVLCILDPAKKRAALSRTAGATLMVLLFAIAMPVAALQPTPASEECDPCETPVARAEAPEILAVAPLAPPQLAEMPVQEPEPAVLAIEEPVELAISEPQVYVEPIRLALDTIPRFEDVIRPALNAALDAVRAMRDSERHGQLHLSNDDWEEIEESIQEAIEDARESYDEAIEEAIEDALEDLDDADWDVSWSDQPDGARVGGYTSEAALDRARRDIERAQRDAQRALHKAERNVQRHMREAELQRERRQAYVEDRVQHEVREQSNQRTNSYSYTISNGRASISQSNGSGAQGWVDGLDNSEQGPGRHRVLALEPRAFRKRRPPRRTGGPQRRPLRHPQRADEHRQRGRGVDRQRRRPPRRQAQDSHDARPPPHPPTTHRRLRLTRRQLDGFPHPSPGCTGLSLPFPPMKLSPALFVLALVVPLMTACTSRATSHSQATASLTTTDPCEDRIGWSNDRERVCETRTFTLDSRDLVLDASINGGVKVTSWDRDEIEIVARIEAGAPTEAVAQQLVDATRIETSGTVRAISPDSKDWPEHASVYTSFEVRVPPPHRPGSDGAQRRHQREGR